MTVFWKILIFFLWEWINVALEYTASCWADIPHRFLTILLVNLATHPLFIHVWNHCGRSREALYVCEGVVFALEWFLLALVWRRHRPWWYWGLVALSMNVASFATGELM